MAGIMKRGAALALTLLTGGCGVPEMKPIQVDPPRDAYIEVLCFSPDGKRLVYSIEHDPPIGTESFNAVVVCEVPTAKELHRLKEEPRNHASFADFSADGSRLAIGYGGSTVRVWDWQDAAEGKKILGARFVDQHLERSPDGKLVVGQPDPLKNEDFPTRYALHVWDAASGQDLRQLPTDGPLDVIGAFSLSADGRYVAVQHAHSKEIGGKGKDRRFRDQLTVDLWDGSTGKRLGPVGEPSPWIERTGAGGPLAAGRLRDVGAEGGFLVRTLPGGRLTLLPDYRKDSALSISKVNGTIVLSEAASGKELRRFDAFPDENFEGNYRVLLSPEGDTLAASGCLDKIPSSKLLIWDVSALNRDAAGRRHDLSDEQLAALWADLADADVSKAHRAMRALAASPDRAVPFLTRRLPPAEDEGIPRLIADLNSDDFEKREKASHELEQLGEKAGAALEQALADKPAAEVKERVEALLKKLTGPAPPDELRALRAVDVLERIGTDEAQKALKGLAGGGPGAFVTLTAKEALDHMDEKSPNKR
jgi:WD40 repeat protein